LSTIFQLIRNQYILERLEKELENLEKMTILEGGDEVEKILERKNRKEGTIGTTNKRS